jgi:flagellin
MDAQALIDTAEGAHIEIEAILQRMRELSVQAANDTNNTTDRANLNTELTQLTSEIDRIANVTAWAGKNLLDGSASSLNFQIGSGTASANQMTVSMNAMTASALSVADGSSATVSAASSLSDTVFATSVSSNVLTISTAAAGQAAVSAQAATAAISERQTLTTPATTNSAIYVLKDSSGAAIATYTADSSATIAEIATGLTGGTDSASATVTVSTDGTDILLDWSDAVDKGLATLEIGGGAIDSSTGAVTETVTLDISAGVGWSATSTNGFSLTITDSNSNSVVLTAAAGSAYANVGALVDAFQSDSDYASAAFTLADDGTDIVVTFNDVNGPSSLSLKELPTTTASAAETVKGDPAQAAVAAQDADSTETITISLGSDSFDLEIDTSTYATEAAQAGQVASLLNANSTFSAQYSAVAVGTTVTFTGLDDTFNISSVANAESAIGAIDTAIQTLNSQRATLGSFSNRLDSTVSNLTNISANLQAGRGRIEDADFAAETTNLAKTQILQQASTAMLAQANAAKQNVLSLLQDLRFRKICCFCRKVSVFNSTTTSLQVC